MILQLGNADFANNLISLAPAVKLPGIEEIQLLDTAHIGQFQLVTLIQSTPDEYANSDLVELTRIFPLTRILVIYGPWCEGDGRNRQLWPQSLRMPWYMADSYIEQTLQQGNKHRPLTAAREEVFRDLYTLIIDRCGKPKVPVKILQVVSSDPAYADSLKDALQVCYSQIDIIDTNLYTQRSIPLADIIYDLDDTSSLTASNLNYLSTLKNHTILLVAGFPHAYSKLPFPVYSKLTPLPIILKSLNKYHLLSSTIPDSQ